MSTGLPRAVKATYYRGGTSRAVMFAKENLPRDETTWPHIFRKVIGSPDPYGRQLNGMGGGISSLSKICVIARSKQPGIDIDYTFIQMGIKDETIDLSSMCGNLSAAIGPFACDSGLVEVSSSDKSMTVRILNTNTNKILHSTFAISENTLDPNGDFAIDGVSGTAAPITLDFVDPAGSKTGKLFPTGNVVDHILHTRVTCIDCGNPAIFVQAADLGLNAAMSPAEIDEQPDLQNRLESIRKAAAVSMGMASAETDTPLAIPKIVMIFPSHSHQLTSGTRLAEHDVDLVTRTMSSKQPHRAIPVTVSLAIAAAADIPGTIISETVPSSRQRANPGNVTIAHPSGRMVVGATWDQFTTSPILKSARILSTARKLMDGVVFI